MVIKIILFLLTSVLSSVTFLGCHVITSYNADPGQFLNKPIIMHRNPWLGTLTGILSIVVFLSLFLNGWFIAKWLGIVTLPISWFIINSTVSVHLKWEAGKKYSNIKNPFYQVFFGGLGWLLVTIINIVVCK